MTRYVPLSQRERPDPAFDEPRDGLPDYFAGPILDWLASSSIDPGTGYFERPYRTEWLMRAQLELGVALDGSGRDITAYDDLQRRMGTDVSFALDVVDFALYDIGAIPEGISAPAGYPPLQAIVDLADILHRGRSEWAVVIGDDRHARLQRRMIGPVDEAIEAVRSARERAHHYLSDAREKIFGVSPEPTDGWHDAVRAVEVVAIPVVLPNDSKATLGKIIAAIAAAPASWTYALGDVSTIVASLRSVWLSEFRHGSPDESIPLRASPEQAAAAFHLALALVQIFATGLFDRASGQ